MSTVRFGDIIRDNDPRMPGRFLAISRVTKNHVEANEVRGSRRKCFRIRISRIHSDGKPRRSGFDLLPRDVI